MNMFFFFSYLPAWTESNILLKGFPTELSSGRDGLSTSMKVMKRRYPNYWPTYGPMTIDEIYIYIHLT